MVFIRSGRAHLPGMQQHLQHVQWTNIHEVLILMIRDITCFIQKGLKITGTINYIL